MIIQDNHNVLDSAKLSQQQLLYKLSHSLKKKLGLDHDGLFYIVKGSCIVRNKEDRFEGKIIREGDFFGEGDLLKCVDYTFFGEIVAQSEQVEVLYIGEDDFHKIPIFE